MKGIKQIDKEEMLAMINYCYPSLQVYDVTPRKDGGVVAFYTPTFHNTSPEENVG